MDSRLKRKDLIHITEKELWEIIIELESIEFPAKADKIDALKTLLFYRSLANAFVRKEEDYLTWKARMAEENSISKKNH